LLLNDPRSDSDGSYYNAKINLQRTSTAAELREAVAKKFEIPVDAFYLVRAANDKDIKEMTRTLD